MKSYTGKTVEDALKAASEDTNTPVDELIYVITDKTKGIFNKKMVVDVYDLSGNVIKTFKFDWDMKSLGRPNPGEFVMVWNFRNEKPMSISQINDNELAISVKNIGEFTSQLHDLNVGDQIYITAKRSGSNPYISDEKGNKIADLVQEK